MKRSKILLLILLLLLLFSILTVTVYADDYFILNTESGKFHRKSCNYLPSSEKRERIDAYELEAELENYAYLSPSPCKLCNPLDHIGDEYEEYEDPVKEEPKVPWKIIFIVAGALIVFYVWLLHHDQKIEDNYNSIINSCKAECEQSYQNAMHQYKTYEEDKEKLKLYVICASFDCSLQRAKKIYNTLHRMGRIDEFIEAESNEHRSAIYEEALEEYSITFIE